MDGKWWWGWTRVEKGLQRSAKCTVQSVIQVRGDDGLTYSWKGLFLLPPTVSFSYHLHHYILLQDLGLGMLSCTRKCQPYRGLANTLIFTGPPQKAKWHFPEAHTQNISQQGEKKNWMTLFGATIFAWPHSSQQVLCPLATWYFFKKGNKKRTGKGENTEEEGSEGAK